MVGDPTTVGLRAGLHCKEKEATARIGDRIAVMELGLEEEGDCSL